MRKLIGFILCAALTVISVETFAQKKQVRSAEKGIKKAADTVAHKTAETAAKGVATITDKTYKDKMGPEGQTVYIDRHSKYYYIDKKGHKVYVSRTQLKDKPKRNQ